MKVLTLTEPYASLVAGNSKRIETRSWSTSYQGELAIHAGKGLAPVGGKRGLLELLAKDPFLGCLRQNAGNQFYLDDIAKSLPYGEILAVCQLVECVPTDKVRLVRELAPSRFPDSLGGWNISEQEWAFGDYSEGRFAWLLEGIKPLRNPVPCKGALGLWTPSEELIAMIREELMP